MIRQFVPEDLDEVMQIWLKTNQEAHNFISPDYWSSHYDMVKEMLPQAEIYVYEKDEKMTAQPGRGMKEMLRISANLIPAGLIPVDLIPVGPISADWQDLSGLPAIILQASLWKWKNSPEAWESSYLSAQSKTEKGSHCRPMRKMNARYISIREKASVWCPGMWMRIREKRNT